MQILGISNNNPFSQKTFADSLKLPFPLLSDHPDFKVIRSYGGFIPNRVTTAAQRWFWLIDREGIVRGQWRGEGLEVFPTEPILQRVREMVGKP